MKRWKRILPWGKKKCWDKGDKDVSWGRNEIKKNCICNSRQSSYCSASLVMASFWGDGGRMQIKGEGPGDRPVAPILSWNLILGIALFIKTMKVSTLFISGQEIHWDDWGGGRGRKRQGIKVVKRTALSLCVFFLQAPQQRQEYKVCQNTEWGLFVWSSRLQKSVWGLELGFRVEVRVEILPGKLSKLSHSNRHRCPFIPTDHQSELTV